MTAAALEGDDGPPAMSRTLSSARALVLSALVTSVVTVSAVWQEDGGRALPALEQRPADAPSWTMDDLLPVVADLGAPRDWMQGGRVFQEAGCGLCHAFSTYWPGNGLAPDLTGVATTYSREFILESILAPSASINGRFYHTEFHLKDGSTTRGSLITVTDGTLVIAPVMMVPDVTVEVSEDDVASEGPSAISPMPEGLIDSFTEEQVRDLFAFFVAGGDPDAAIYKP